MNKQHAVLMQIMCLVNCISRELDKIIGSLNSDSIEENI